MKAAEATQKVIRDLRSIDRQYSSALKQELTWFLRKMLNEAKKNSPVDTSTFQRRWKFTTTSSGVTTTGTVSNDLDYGQWIEQGSEKGKDPWPKVGRRTAFGPGGRIFSSQAIGGVIEPLFSGGWMSRTLDEFSLRFLNRWIRGLT